LIGCSENGLRLKEEKTCVSGKKSIFSSSPLKEEDSAYVCAGHGLLLLVN